MTNPTALDLKVPSPEFFDDYEVGGTYTPPPQAKENVEGRQRQRYVVYTAQLPPRANFEIGGTKDGYLKVVIKGIKVLYNDGQDREYEVRESHVGSKQYNKYDSAGNITGTRNSSPFGDLIRAAGIDAKPASPEEYEALVDALADRQIQVTIDWSAYDKDAGKDIAEKYDDFPLEGQGPARQPFIEVGGKRFWARGSIKRWVSAI